MLTIRLLSGKLRRPLALAALIVVVACGPSADAQATARYKKDDDIQVFFLNSWLDATVLETNRNQVLAEFEFAGAAKRQAFNADQVRFAFEADALARARFWSDASGKFRIRAALLRIEEGTAVLRKEDLAEVKVPVNKLSDADQAFIKRLEKELGPKAAAGPTPPPVEQFETAQSNIAFSSFGSEQRAALPPDPVPAYQKLTEGGVAFPMLDFFDRLGAVLPLGGQGSYLLAAVENATPGGQLPTRVLWASLEKKKIAGQQLLPPGEVVLDYHASSHRLLTYTELENHGNATGKSSLTIWEVLPSDKQVKGIVRWNADAGQGAPWEPWARMVDANTVVHRWKKQEYVGWNLSAKAMQYRLNQESFFAPLPTLSGNRKYLFLPEDKQVRVIDAVSGDTLSTFPSADGSAAVAVTEDGRQAAVLGRTTLTVWDLTDANAAPETYQAEAIGTPFQAKLTWVGDQRVMADQGAFGQVLFGLAERLAIWNYQFDHDAVRESDGRRLREIVDQHLVYAASVSSGNERGLAVGAVRLPGPKVDAAVAALNRDALNIMKPGSAVRLELKCGEHNARIQAALEKKVADNQWVLNASAPATLTAEMSRGETQTVTYHTFGLGGAEQSATITPFISQLKLEVGGKLAWQSGTSTGAPPIMHLQEGESVQAKLNEWQHPNPGFFETVDIPASILDPDKRKGLGVTNVSSRGLVPK